jgi:hypothetical protein
MGRRVVHTTFLIQKKYVSDSDLTGSLDRWIDAIPSIDTRMAPTLAKSRGYTAKTYPRAVEDGTAAAHAGNLGAIGAAVSTRLHVLERHEQVVIIVVVVVLGHGAIER